MQKLANFNAIFFVENITNFVIGTITVNCTTVVKCTNKVKYINVVK